MTNKRLHLSANARRMIYNEMKLRNVGDSCSCPVCGDTFVKRQWQQAFCSAKCKNWFWNKAGDRHSDGYAERYAERVVEKGNEFLRKEIEKRPHWYFDECGILRFSEPVFNGKEYVMVRAN